MNDRKADRTAFLRRWAIKRGNHSIARGEARLTALLLFAILTLGGGLVWWTVVSDTGEMRAELLRQAALAGQAVAEDFERIEVLVNTTGATDNPDYCRIKEQLAIVRAANPQCRFLHLLGRKSDGTFFCIVDSEAVGARNYSPPGRVYTEVSQEYHLAFEGKVASIRGPRVVARELLIRAVVPVLNPSDGAVITALSMDVAASPWIRRMVVAVLLPVLITASLAGVVLVLSLVRSRPGRRRHAEAAAVAAFGVILTLYVAMLVHQDQERHKRSAFSLLAQSHAARVVNTAYSLKEKELEALARFVEGREQLSKEEFSRFASFLSRNPAVQAWEWIPAVREEGRTLLEQELRVSGASVIGIWQKDESGSRTSAEERPIYYPVLYAEPSVGNERALGYDLGSDPVRRAALEEAERTGLETATAPVTLVQETTSQRGMLVFHPIFDLSAPKRLRGYVLSVLRMGTLLATSTTVSSGADAVAMDLMYLRPDKPGEMLASTRNGRVGVAPTDGYSAFFPIFFSDKVLALEITPLAAFEGPVSIFTLWIVVLLGSVLTFVTAFSIGKVLAHRRELEWQIGERMIALQEKTQRYELVLEGVQGGVIDWDVVNNRVHLSTGWLAMHGCDPAGNADGRMDWKSTIHPDDLPRVLSALEEHFAGVTAALEQQYRICCPEGVVKHVVFRAKVVRDAAGAVTRMAGSETDITDRKKMGEILDFERERLRSILAGTNAGTWEWHVPTGELVVNSGWAGMLGYTLEELSPISIATWEELAHPDDLRMAREMLDRNFRGELDAFACELRMRHKDGNWVWVSTRGKVTHWTEDGAPLFMFGTHHDITARKQAEERLQESEANFRAFFSSMTDPILVCTPDGRILFANAATEEKLGYTPHELGTMHVLDLHPLECRAEAEAIFSEMFRGERDCCPLPLAGRDGSHIPVETRVWSGKWNGQDCIFGVSKDLSAEQEAQQRFERLFRNNPALMAVSSASSRQFVDVNDAFLSTLGYARNEVIGKTAEELGLFVNQNQHTVELERLKSAGLVSHVELDVRCRNGGILRGLFSGELIYSQGHMHLLSVMVDITARRMAEDKLRESEEAYRNQFAKNTAVMLLVDPDGGAIMDANAAAEAYYGYSRERLRSMSVTDINILPPDEVQGAMRTVPNKKGKRFSFQHRLADGSVRDVEVSSSNIPFAGRTVLHSIIHDVTDRLRTEHALQQTTTRLSLATQAGGVGIWDYYVIENRLVWDEQMFRLYGITEDQFSGAYEAWQAGLHPDDRQRGDEEIQRALRGEKEFDTEFRVVWPDGSIHSIRALAVVYRDASGRPLRLIGTNWDITARKEAEAEITRQASLIRSLLDSIPDIIFFKDVHGVYLGCNPPFAEFAGRPRDEIIGKTDYDLFDKETADHFRFNDLRMLEQRESRHNEESICYPDGRKIIIDTLKTPYWAADGALIGVLGISRDITARKQAEDALRDLNETIALQVKEQVAENMALERALIHQSRLAAIGEMLNNIAHQWRQPLNALGIALANLQDAHRCNELDDACMAASVGTANRLIQKMSTTINDFRTFFQPNKEMVYFSLREQITLAVSLVEPNFKSARISIRVLGDDDLMFQGIPNEYSQVLLNLLMNAREAVVAHKPAQGLVEIEVQERDGNACVIIRDNGGGIPKDVLDRIFEPYFTTKPQGSGIGLYMSEMIISRRMNGRIEARNTGDGAEMAIITPLRPETGNHAKEEVQ